MGRGLDKVSELPWKAMGAGLSWFYPNVSMAEGWEIGAKTRNEMYEDKPLLAMFIDLGAGMATGYGVLRAAGLAARAAPVLRGAGAVAQSAGWHLISRLSSTLGRALPVPRLVRVRRVLAEARSKLVRFRGRAIIAEGSQLAAGASKAERIAKFFGLYPNVANPARQAVLVERHMAQGFSRDAAEALARPYTGMGEHLIKREWLRAVRLPETALDTPLTLLRPRGISFGEMYELHFRVDRSFWGARMPGGLPSWRGKLVLGAKAKYGPVGKAWFGTPIGLKATGAAAGTGYAVYRVTRSPPDATKSSPDSEVPK